jgi:PBP1b-binding outer membrane lipoprotein LpoB
MKKLLITALALFITGCGGGEKVEKKPAVKKKPLTKTEELKRKAKLTEAASMVGYDGKRIHKDLNKIIDANQKSVKDMEDLMGK